MKFLKDLFKKNSSLPIIPNYPFLLSKCELDLNKIDECKSIVLTNWPKNKLTYDKISIKTSVPSWLIFAIHYKEASCSVDGALHNGDRCIGNNKKTWNVPKGRGPFKTWEESAIDALLLKQNIFPKNWNYLPDCLEFAERYNGLGHRSKGELSPYIWSYTNHHDETGNYVSDGKYVASAKIESPGVAALLLALVLVKELKISEEIQNVLTI